MQDENGNHVSLREYIERIFSERAAALDLAFKAQQDALALASRTLELRLEKLNELRQEVTLDRNRYVTNDKYDAALKSTTDRIGVVEGFQNRVIGIGLVLVVAAGGLGVVIANVLHR